MLNLSGHKPLKIMDLLQRFNLALESVGNEYKAPYRTQNLVIPDQLGVEE